MSHQGVDLSNWNGPISAQQAQEAKAQGLDFAYILLTDGKSFKNPDAPGQVKALRDAGILVGFYHFFRPADPVYDQVVSFLMYAHGCGGSSLPLALDSEVAGANWQTLAYGMMQFARQIEAVNTDITNNHSLLYVNENFYDNLAPRGFAWGRWVWGADPSGTWGTRQRLVWQQAPRALPPAFPKATDYDLFVGSDADWLAFTGAPPVEAQVAKTGPVAVAGGPGGEEMYVIGQMIGPGGLYQGFNVRDGKTVFAGAGDPTTWWIGWNAKALPQGTPIAVAYADRDFVDTSQVVTEYL